MNSHTFQIGDTVRNRGTGSSGCDVLGDGATAPITGVKDGQVEIASHCWVDPAKIELVQKTSNPNTPMSMTTILEKAALAFKKEPERSLRKAGLTNGDDMLTAEGQTVFLSWLLHNKYAADFKKEVVDDMLKEQEESK